MHGSLCDPAAHAPGLHDVPSPIISWWYTTGSLLVCVDHDKTLSLPPPVYSAWTSRFPDFTGLSVVLSGSTTAAVPTSTSESGSSTLSNETSTSSSVASASPSDDQSSTLPMDTTSSSVSNIPVSSSSAVEISLSLNTGSSGVSVSTDSGSQVSPSSSLTATSPPTIAAAVSHNKNKTARIVAGVLVPLVVIALGIAAFIIYKRRRRVHDRREWERTHEEIADAVRQVGAATPVAILAAGPPAWGDAKPVLDSDSRAPPMDSSGGTPPGSLGHPNGSDHGLLSHSRASSA